MRNFKKVISVLLALILTMSVISVLPITVSAESSVEVLSEDFSGSAQGWTVSEADSKHWEITKHKNVTGYEVSSLHYKGTSKQYVTYTSPAFDLSKGTDYKFYIEIGVKKGTVLENDKNTLKVVLSSTKKESKGTILNLHSAGNFEWYSTEDGLIKAMGFTPAEKYYPSAGRDSVTLNIQATGNVEFYIGKIKVSYTDKTASNPSSSNSSSNSSGSSSGNSSNTSSSNTQTQPGENGSQSITKININLSDPKVNTTQPTQVSGTGFTGSIEWTPNEIFVGGKQYVAQVTLNASNGYQFSKATEVIVPSATPANLKITSDKITFQLTYVPESSTIKITQISYDYITRTTARLVMETSGSEEILEKYFEYGTQIGNYTGKSLDGTLTDLTSNTIYYYRAVVVTPAGQIMSEPSSFRTSAGITIVTKASSGGTVTPFGSSEVAKGDTLTVTVTPNEGYVINFVTVDEKDIELDEDGSYTFSNISADHVLYAAFKPATAAANTEDDGSSGFVKFLIILAAIILAAAILIFLLKPKGMGFGDLCAAIIIKIRRWNYRRKMSKRRVDSNVRKRNIKEDYYDDDEYGYDDDDFDEELPVLGQSEQKSVNKNTDSYGYDDEFSSKYDFDRFK